MDIEEFSEAKRVMEREISEAAVRAVQRFLDKTGRTPHSIYIEMIEGTMLGESRRKFMPVSVRTEVEI